MSVTKVINGHAAHQFEKLVRDLAKQKGYNIAQFSQALGARNSGGVYGPLKGRHVLTQTMAERWARALDVPTDILIEANKPIATLVAQRKAAKAARKPRRKSPGRIVTKPVTSIDEISHHLVSRSEVASRPERFAMSVNADGTAHVRLDVSDLPLELALRLVEAIGLPELINNNNRASSVRRISHEKKED